MLAILLFIGETSMFSLHQFFPIFQIIHAFNHKRSSAKMTVC